MKNQQNYNFKPELIPGTPVGISIYSVTREAPHHHEGFLEIIYCFKGPVTIFTRLQAIELQEGDIISCDPFDIHYLSCDTDNLLISFYFDLRSPVFNKPDLEHIYFICEPLATPQTKQPELQNLKRLLLTMLYFYCFPHPKLSVTEIVTRFSMQIIKMMLDHFHYFYFIANSTDYSDEMKDRFESIIIYIDKNYSQKITLEKMCELYHFNYKYLSRFFKKTSFVGFPKFVNDIRSYKATALLLDTDKNISDIAYESGFSAPLYFYQVFEKWNGTTPNKYRKVLREAARNSGAGTYYDVMAKKEELEHSISFNFAELQVPELWASPFVPYKGLPFEIET